MTTPGKAKLLADESARDLDAGLGKVHAGKHPAAKDEAHVERDPEPAETEEKQRR